VKSEHLLGRVQALRSSEPRDTVPSPMAMGSPLSLPEEVRQLERRRIVEALKSTGGVRVRAAQVLGMPLRTLVTKISRYGLSDIRGPKVRRG
jgi:transcriptional regulator with GAF, ATPase, and Fis domain